MGKGKGDRQHSPNDMQSMAKNPNNPAFKAAVDNRSTQLNPDTPAYSSSRKGSGGSARQSDEERSEES